MSTTAANLESEFQLLLGRDPYKITEGKIVDTVQNEVLRYFNAAAQFHMESGLRNRFISARVPDVSPKLRPIISGADAEEFYRGLSVPYIALTLKSSTDPAVKHLNTMRAERRISDSMRTSKTYRTQAQQLHALAWQEQFPGTALLKDDQRQNSRGYKEAADAALTAFINTECESGDENMKSVVRGILNKYLVEAQSGKYWAFRVLLAYLTNQNLASLNPESDANRATTDSASPSRKLLRQCAVLNAMDDSGKFATFLQDMVRHGIFSVALPKKIDFLGNEKELGVICNAILDGFTQQTEAMGPEYDKLRSGVQVLLAKEDGERNLDRLFSMFFAMAQDGSGRSLEGWLNTHIRTADLRDIGAFRKYSPKIGLQALSFARLGAQLMALSGIVMMMSNGISWGQMTAKERTAAVVAGVDLFLVSAPKVLSLGVVTLPDAWTSLATWMKSRSPASNTLARSMSMTELRSVERLVTRSRSLSAAALLRSETVGVQVESGLRKWLTGKMTSTIATTSRRALAAGGEVTLVGRLFGRNLDHFMATRVGLILAISGLALGIWGIVTAKDDKERWINIALTAAAAMEVCSVGIGMLGTTGLVGRVGSFLGPIGMIASIAVVGYMIYDAATQEPPPSIIAQFVKNEAQKAGLYMPYQMDIDYLASIGSSGVGAGVTVGAGDDFLQLDLENSPCAIVRNSHKTDYDADTVFDLDVDGQGYVTLTSRGYSADANPYTGTPERKRRITVLMAGAEKTVIAGALSVTEGDEDSAAWGWTWESKMLKAGVKKNDIPQSGEFSLRNKKTQLYLALANGAVALSSAPFGWTLTSGVPMRKRFTYATNRFDATTSEIPVDEDQAGATPITWRGQNLPPFITLADDGALKVDDSRLETVDKHKTWRFTVTASNAGGSFRSEVDLRYRDDFDDDTA